jgi:histidinol dehydrogenase
MKTVTFNELKDYRRTLLDVDRQVFDTVQTIIEDVRKNGDAAVKKYTKKFDTPNIDDLNLVVSRREIDDAIKYVESEMAEVFRCFLKAADNIEEFHYAQKEESWASSSRKNICGMLILPIERVGLYVPGWKGFYPSSAIMNIVPAKVAGVNELIISTPPDKEGKVNPLLLALADRLGADRIIKAGGAQAIAAMAFGTESVPNVYKITGPGNSYVTAAKRLVSGVVGIDSLAGPSEVVVFADNSANPEWVAIDLCAQAEHTDDTTSILISTSADFIAKVNAELDRIIPSLERSDIIKKSIETNSMAIVVDTIEDGFDIANRIAPEHIEIMLNYDEEKALNMVKNAGAIFLGHHTPVAVGDYYYGPNHVLPTNGTATFSSPLGVYDFVKRTSFMGVTSEYLKEHGKNIETMANFEGFSAHALSVKVRREV